MGDLAYGSCGRLLCGRKHPTAHDDPPFTVFDVFWNHLIAHYRSRVEKVIRRVKAHTWCEVPFRCSYPMLVQFLEMTIISTALEIREEFLTDKHPMFEVVGPWDHVFQ